MGSFSVGLDHARARWADVRRTWHRWKRRSRLMNPLVERAARDGQRSGPWLSPSVEEPRCWHRMRSAPQSSVTTNGNISFAANRPRSWSSQCPLSASPSRRSPEAGLSSVVVTITSALPQAGAAKAAGSNDVGSFPTAASTRAFTCTQRRPGREPRRPRNVSAASRRAAVSVRPAANRAHRAQLLHGPSCAVVPLGVRVAGIPAPVHRHSCDDMVIGA